MVNKLAPQQISTHNDVHLQSIRPHLQCKRQLGIRYDKIRCHTTLFDYPAKPVRGWWFRLRQLFDILSLFSKIKTPVFTLLCQTFDQTARGWVYKYPPAFQGPHLVTFQATWTWSTKCTPYSFLNYSFYCHWHSRGNWHLECSFVAPKWQRAERVSPLR